jgi:uncharacterized membrane protein
MSLLTLGLAIWTAAHFFKRLAPNARAALTARFGEGGSKGVMAAIIGLGLVLMIIGYRASPDVAVYAPPSWGLHLNNLAMLAAVALMGLGDSKSRARTWLRHPMLAGVIVWGLAHLLVNGDLASLILCGGLGAWAVVQMMLINHQEPDWVGREPGTKKGDLRLLLITVVLFAVIAAIHTWLGYWPFPGKP